MWPATALACIAIAGAAHAADPVQVLRIEGTCKVLIVAGADRSADCAGQVAYTLRGDGRSDFLYEAQGAKRRDQGASVAFSGQALAETHPGRGVTALPVDSVTLDRGGPPVPAIGECRYGDPFAGPAAIRCTATSNDAHYEGDFVSNGVRSGAVRR